LTTGVIVSAPVVPRPEVEAVTPEPLTRAFQASWFPVSEIVTIAGVDFGPANVTLDALRVIGPVGAPCPHASAETNNAKKAASAADRKLRIDSP
jgi:hypothetical protein